MSTGGPTIDDPAVIAQLRAVLVEADFTAAAVSEALSTEVTVGREAAEIPLYLRALPEGRLSGLIKLFVLGLGIPRTEAEAALAPLPLERLAAIGVLELDGDIVSATFDLVPTEDLLIACDSSKDELAHPDHVLGVSLPAKVLAWLTVRRPVERVLDLGTGNGHQALLATRHADDVVGVDINPRALRFAAFNAILNGVDGIELREGDLFGPVEGEQFDLIVSNPPYVISPESEIVYRDGGMPGDSFCEGIVRSVPAYLRPGGIAQILIGWTHGADEDWQPPVQAWVDRSGCDAILLRYAVHRPLDYAAGWNRPYRDDPAVYGAALDRWTSYHASLGIEAISWGALILRRRDGTNWFWAYQPSAERITGASTQVQRLFAAQDYLAERDDSSLLDARLTLDPAHAVEQTIRLREGRELIERNVLRLEGGLRFEVSIDGSTERVLTLLDGDRPLHGVLDEVAGEAGIDPDRFRVAALPVVRRLIELGFVYP